MKSQYYSQSVSFSTNNSIRTLNLNYRNLLTPKYNQNIAILYSRSFSCYYAVLSFYSVAIAVWIADNLMREILFVDSTLLSCCLILNLTIAVYLLLTIFVQILSLIKFVGIKLGFEPSKGLLHFTRWYFCFRMFVQVFSKLIPYFRCNS